MALCWSHQVRKPRSRQVRPLVNGHRRGYKINRIRGTLTLEWRFPHYHTASPQQLNHFLNLATNLSTKKLPHAWKRDFHYHFYNSLTSSTLGFIYCLKSFLQRVYNNTQSFNLIHHFICIQLLLHLWFEFWFCHLTSHMIFGKMSVNQFLPHLL